ncbi:AMP-binding enzyme [Plectosphaerella plurivora]|uniref:AMP-binding enzyme n=1 Tax=Plectosphaerella plurivora TaxID=936078 RepID=A0A9P8VMI2_9PEZI|nr:AMP-binding enzyme [Plectosphaerella plurivora]
MPVPSRWKEDIPNCSLQQWIFGSSSAPLSDEPIFIDADRPDTHKVTLAGYRLLAKRVAVGLAAKGVRPGDRVLLFSGNSIYFPSVFLGVLMAGAIFTGANPGFVPRELAYQIKDSGAVIVIAAAASLDTAIEAAAQVGLPASSVYVFDTTIPDSSTLENKPTKGARHWTELIGSKADGNAFSWTEPKDAGTTTCCLNYSSGTTGVPKGVEISHRSYVANGVGVTAVAALAEDYAESIKRSRGLCFLPLYHAYGQTYFIANFAKQGIPSYIMPSFDFLKLLQHIQRYRITNLTAVPPILVALTKHPLVKDYDLTSIESVGCGAAPLGAEVAHETERVLRRPDVVVRQGWGMTEITCTALTWDPRSRDPATAVGEIMPNCAAMLVDADGREVTEARKPGELWISGPTVMRGYWKNPKATAETIVTDKKGTRWLRTGDIAYVEKYEPGGLWYIVDRIKELIKVKGNQVAPAELEALLLERPDVADAAVVGVTIQGSELPRAYIVRAENTNATAEEIAKWLEGRVARHKRLAGGVAFVDVVPKNPSGKILRKILREKAKEEVGDRDPPASKLS